MRIKRDADNFKCICETTILTNYCNVWITKMLNEMERAINNNLISKC